MTLLIQISDPHFGTEQPQVLEALVRLVHEQKPELAVMSGDITQRALRAEFRAAKHFIERLQVPATLVIPGNHDIPLFNLADRIFRPYANYQRELGADLEPRFESDSLLVIAVKTTRRYRHADGEVSQPQIDRVAALLQRATDKQLRIVVTHQPVCVTRPEDKTNLLHGHEAAIRSWATAGADLILGGHIHLPYVRPLHERYPDLARRVWAVQAGTAVSDRVRYDAGNSVNLIHYDSDATPRQCAIERWDYLVRTQGFEPAAVYELRFGAEAHVG
ncbi:MAG TPA: metallophosphoesterase [Methylophilaceae bacterium]|nr:metallophosphoesterase [Methylophilaceae bacterium]